MPSRPPIRPTLTSAIVLAATAIALIASGCGGGGDATSDANRAVRDYVQARNDGDLERECSFYSQAFIDTELGGVEDCPGFIKEAASGGARNTIKVIEVRVAGDRASADLNMVGEGDAEPVRVTLLFEQDADGNWKVTGRQ